MAKKSTFKHLRMLASQLPQQLTEGNVYLKGADILEHNKTTKDKEGNEIEPGKIYKATTIFEISNYRRLKKLFKKMGEAGVNAYIDDIIKQQTEEIKNHAKVLQGFPVQPMSI